MNMENMNMTPSEKLHSILDGETAGIDTSEVFYELSNSPELQQEFLDLMKMKQLMHGKQEAPPEHLRRGIMAGVGLGGSGLWYYLQNSGMVAASAAFLGSKVGAVLIAGMVGVFATFMIMDNDSPEKVNTESQSVSNANVQLGTMTSAELVLMEVPVVSSSSVDSKTTNNTNRTTNNYNGNGANRNAIIASDVNDNTNRTERKSTHVNEVSNVRNYDFVLISNSPNAVESSSDELFEQKKSQDLAYNKEFSTFNNSNQPSGFIVNPSNRMSAPYSEQLMMFSLQGKGMTNNSLLTPDMSTTEAPSINNIGIALMYSVNDEFALGLEFGQEFFVKRIRTNSFNTEESMLDNQLTFWGGLKASYTFNDLQIVSNLRPTTTILVGGTSNGWVTKASAGLVYDISNKLAVFGGPEWTSGFYQFDSQIFASNKWGFHYGLALKF